MHEIDFTTMTDVHPANEILTMMRALYTEDNPASIVDHRRFPSTIELLLEEPSRGRIVLFTKGESIHGYSLLIPYWSNEFGGTILWVDELFVVSKSRNCGIGHRFFEFLDRERPFNAVAIALEVSPVNVRAHRFYESLGFSQRSNAMLTYRFPSAAVA